MPNNESLRPMVLPKTQPEWDNLRHEFARRTKYEGKGQQAEVVAVSGSRMPRRQFERMLLLAQNGPDQDLEEQKYLLEMLKGQQNLTYPEALLIYQQQKLRTLLSFVLGQPVEVATSPFQALPPEISEADTSNGRDDKKTGKTIFRRIDDAARETAAQLSHPFRR